MTTLAAFQPQPWPRLHLLDRIATADITIVMESAQFSRTASGGGQRRLFIGPTRRSLEVAGSSAVRPQALPIRVPKGSSRLPISAVRLDEGAWRGDLTSLFDATYSHLPGWLVARRSIGRALFTDRMYVLFWSSLRDALELAGLTHKLVTTDQLVYGGPARAGDLMLAYCREVGADTFLCGEPGLAYLDQEKFAAHGVTIRAQEWTPPVYQQSWMPSPGALGLWLPNLSWLDAVAHGVDLRTAIGGS